MWGEYRWSGKVNEFFEMLIVLATKNEKENNNLDEDGGWKNENEDGDQDERTELLWGALYCILSDRTERAGLMFRRR
ncbi:hypothetical protein LSTR_LSTR011216 [Laodelphax striatellus]|uniref:Uncharacterized protein n=1 Tax=Laodelphax striatellus TaxID=195883 RepID=A0A482WMR4_LAOST|nr:hypothetical protein LSTR_LSTR011216 [Laodelphax striatellus]